MVDEPPVGRCNADFEGVSDRMKLLSKSSSRSASAEQTTTAEPSAPAERPSPSPASGPRKSSGKKRILAIVLILAVVGGGAAFLLLRGAGQEDDVSALYTYTSPEKREIVETLTGSGVLEPADSYTVTSLVAEDILSADFEEGDFVTKGDVLYEMDSSTASTSIERTEIAVAQAGRNYTRKLNDQADLTVTAPIGGTISGFTVRVGDTVRADTAVAVIEDTSTLTLTEYYSQEYAGQIWAGMAATISVPGQMLSLHGQVRETSSQLRTSETGIVCFAVTVEFANPGSLSPGLDAAGRLEGNIYPSVPDDDGLDALSRQIAYADVTGTAAELCVRNGETVTAGAPLLRLSSDDLPDELLSAADQLRDAELALRTQYDALENYTVTAPIDGTIVDKYYKVGEKSEAGKPLCIIYDLSSLTLTLAVDELDIRLVKVGQNAVITADAVEEESYAGVITRVGVNGTNTGGVTTYPVDIRIDLTGELLPSMNADVSIVVDRRDEALAIPADAVDRGGRVLVKNAEGKTAEGAPQGYDYVSVGTGISDGDWVEILSGLEEGDEIAYIPASTDGTTLFELAMGMSPGGGMAAPPMGGGA